MKDKIYYIMDPMCGWCYGFSDVITKINDKYKGNLEFAILPGGMWRDENVKKMNSQLASYIKSHNKQIESLTNKHFGEGFEKNILQNEGAILDSIPGSKAIAVVQNLDKDVLFKFVKKLQEQVYVYGKNLNDLELLSDIANSFGIDKETFKEHFNSEKIENITKNYFKVISQLGVQSFPSVVVEKDDKYTLISQGYMEFDKLDKIIAQEILRK